MGNKTTIIKINIMENLENVVNQVYETTDYSMFKTIKGNRNINPLHLARLKNSFKERYLFTPVLVNSSMEIIDGQHRVEAAAELNLPIRFIKLNGYGLREIQIYNTNMKNWKKGDYLLGWVVGRVGAAETGRSRFSPFSPQLSGTEVGERRGGVALVLGGTFPGGARLALGTMRARSAAWGNRPPAEGGKETLCETIYPFSESIDKRPL